jgi:Glycosyl hydrolases family 17
MNLAIHVTFFLLTCYCFSAATIQRNAHTGLDRLGVNWGTMTSHPINPSIIVEMLRANGIKKVKLFDADPWNMNALSGSHIETMVAIPNDQLSQIAGNYNYAQKWVKNNVTRYYQDHGVQIRYAVLMFLLPFSLFLWFCLLKSFVLEIHKIDNNKKMVLVILPQYKICFYYSN